MRFFRTLPLAALGLLLAGCPDPSPILGLTGAVAERQHDGAVKVIGVVRNGGDDPFDGTICLTARWLRGAEVESVEAPGQGTKTRAIGGELVDEAGVCVERELEPDEDAFFEVRSTAPLEGEGIVIDVQISHHGDGTADPATPNRVIGMPPS